MYKTQYVFDIFGIRFALTFKAGVDRHCAKSVAGRRFHSRFVNAVRVYDVDSGVVVLYLRKTDNGVDRVSISSDVKYRVRRTTSTVDYIGVGTLEEARKLIENLRAHDPETCVYAIDRFIDEDWERGLDIKYLFDYNETKGETK